MPFDVKDPRASLAPTKTQSASEFAGTEYARFYAIEADEKSPDAKTWYVRGQNFIVAYSEVLSGASFSRNSQPDEYVVLLPDETISLNITANGETSLVAGHSLAIVPPGDSCIRVLNDGYLIRLFSIRSEDLVVKCSNAASYATPHPNVAPFEPWPAPPDGYRLRAYSLDVPPEEGRFGRIWRCSTFMVNYLEPSDGPRDITKLSPHSHDDFEQCSLSVAGEFVHHIRWPWTTNQNNWREDEHEHCGTPSVAVIPPPAVHTTAAVGKGINQLVDIFCPPRRDFSEKTGWVLNSDAYPMP